MLVKITICIANDDMMVMIDANCDNSDSSPPLGGEIIVVLKKLVIMMIISRIRGARILMMMEKVMMITMSLFSDTYKLHVTCTCPGCSAEGGVIRR